LRLQHRDNFDPALKDKDVGFRVVFRWTELDERRSGK